MQGWGAARHVQAGQDAQARCAPACNTVGRGAEMRRTLGAVQRALEGCQVQAGCLQGLLLQPALAVTPCPGCGAAVAGQVEPAHGKGIPAARHGVHGVQVKRCAKGRRGGAQGGGAAPPAARTACNRGCPAVLRRLAAALAGVQGCTWLPCRQLRAAQDWCPYVAAARRRSPAPLPADRRLQACPPLPPPD